MQHAIAKLNVNKNRLKQTQERRDVTMLCAEKVVEWEKFVCKRKKRKPAGNTTRVHECDVRRNVKRVKHVKRKSASTGIPSGIGRDRRMVALCRMSRYIAGSRLWRFYIHPHIHGYPRAAEALPKRHFYYTRQHVKFLAVCRARKR